MIVISPDIVFCIFLMIPFSTKVITHAASRIVYDNESIL